MAAIYKCTKVTNQGESQLVTGAYQLRVDYVNPATSPPTPGSVTLQMAYGDVEDPVEIQTNANALLGLLGGDTINWAL